MSQIRDYLYLDHDRLTSFYAQMFGGVPSSFSQAQTIAKTSEMSSRSLSGSVAEEGNHSQSGSVAYELHDFMFRQVEESLDGQIEEISDVNRDTAQKLSLKRGLVRVNASARLLDYQRIRDFAAGRFDEICKFIVRPLFPKRYELEQAEKDVAIYGRVGKYSQNLAKLEQELVRFAYQQGLQLGPKTLAIERMLAIYSNEFADLLLVGSNLDFRAVLEERYMRTEPEVLRLLYGNGINHIMTLVGQITWVPSVDELERDSTEGDEINEHFRKMVDSLEEMERKFVVNAREVVVRPLAIYQGLALEVPKAV